MKKHLNLKKNLNLKKGVLIFSELLVLLLILGSAMVMTDSGISGQSSSSDVQDTLSPALAPVNSEFTTSQNIRVYKLGETSNGHETGLVPATVDLQNVGHASSFRSLSATPYYDLRELNKITSVKDQGMTGSCWAFATYASLESYFKPGESLDLSENNLKNLLSSAYSEGFDFSEGGNMFMSTAYLARWGGPVNEANDPYSDSSSYSPSGLPVEKHAQDIIFLSDREGPLDNQEIKSAVQTYGAIYTSMCYDNSCYSSATSSYYFSGSDYSNHAVAIVGWNDSYDRNNFNTIPPGDGAFIIKNSWGTGWGDQGYFYVSYYDSNIGTENGVFKAESTDNYGSIYQYDPLGWVLSTGYSNPVCWAANIFTAESNEDLKAVSFYTTNVNCNYEIYIYTNPTSNPINQASLALTQTGTISNAGYHTVNLNSAVPLQAGQKFSVVLKLTTSGYNYPIAIEYPYSGYSSKARANAGQSFISANGLSWTDITNYYSNTNVCIKAFTDPASELPGAPVANFSATPRSGTAPLQVNFTDTSTGSPNTWYWNFGDGTSSTEQSPTHIYSASGTYSVSLTATNNAGSDTETKSSHIIVTASQPPVASFRANVTSGTAPLSIAFTDTSTRSPTSWYWDFGDGTTSTEQNPIHVYNKAGRYTVSLRATNNGGSNTFRRSNYITVTAPRPPVANFRGNATSGTIPLSVTFTDTSTRSPTSWYWDFGDGTSSTEQNPTHVYEKVGRYTVSLKATNNGGSNTLRRSNYITVTAPRPPVANFRGNATSGTTSLSVTFTDTSTRSPTSWYWDFGDGTSSTEQNPTHVYEKVGRYTVSLKATNNGGSNTLRRSNYITVTAPRPPVANFKGNATSGTTSLSVTFTDTSTRSPTSWYWDFGDGTSSTEQNPTHVYEKVGRYTVSLKATNNGGSNTLRRSNYITVTAPRPPVANFRGNATSGTTSLSVTFTDTSTRSPTSWYWDFGDGTSSTEQNPTHVYEKVGRYTVSLKATNNGGSNTLRRSNYITVTAPRPPTASFVANKVSGKAQLIVTFTDRSSGTPTSWNWNFGDGTYSTSKNPVHTYSSAGRYTVSLTATNAAGSNTMTRRSYVTVSR